MSTPEPSCQGIVSLTQNDIPEILCLVEKLNWTHVEADLNVMFRAGSFLGLREDCGKIIATGAIFPYGDNLASIGMIMVAPDHQRKGYGRAVMQDLHDSKTAQGRRLCLIATDEGEQLYKALGYHVTSRIRKFFADPELLLETSTTVVNFDCKMRHLTENDFSDVIELDSQSIGASREKLLRLRFAQSGVGVVIEGQNGKLIAFALSSLQREQCHLGPIVAPDRDTALILILGLADNNRRELRIDIPEEQSVLYELLPELGFRLIANPPAMTRPVVGATEFDSQISRSHYWAIMSQAYG
ncbi:GNAT family N-acetyltransferase [Kiloniella sp.]|uniref:GNAT family N-acetyltransferase n=1 Tax=Kiloniella sp. TaxID=1938587 RepID=UPI003B0188A7